MFCISICHNHGFDINPCSVKHLSYFPLSENSWWTCFALKHFRKIKQFPIIPFTKCQNVKICLQFLVKKKSISLFSLNFPISFLNYISVNLVARGVGAKLVPQENLSICTQEWGKYLEGFKVALTHRLQGGGFCLFISLFVCSIDCNAWFVFVCFFIFSLYFVGVFVFHSLEALIKLFLLLFVEINK